MMKKEYDSMLYQVMQFIHCKALGLLSSLSYVSLVSYLDGIKALSTCVDKELKKQKETPIYLLLVKNMYPFFSH